MVGTTHLSARCCFDQTRVTRRLGIATATPSPTFSRSRYRRNPDTLATMPEYLEVKAVHRVNLHSGMHFVPWFVIYKPKARFINACVDINARLRPPPYFRLPNWGKIFPCLVKGHWALKIDLKHAYFRLALSPELRRFFNSQIGSNVLQCDSACFWLHYIPYYWTQLMKIFSSKWRALGIVVFIYLDNIIILGPSRRYLLRVRPLVLQDLTASGVTINFPKSLLEPSQVIDALGFVVDFTAGELLGPACKRKGYRKEAGKVSRSHFMTLAR